MKKIRFLCANHIRWLECHTNEILSAWNNATEQGVYYQDRNMWQEAVTPLGCAYELAALRLELEHKGSSNYKDEKDVYLDTRKENLDQAFFSFAESSKQFLFALINAGHESLANETIDHILCFFRRLDRQEKLTNPRQISELIRTLRVIRYAEVDLTMDIKNKFLTSTPISPRLTLQ